MRCCHGDREVWIGMVLLCENDGLWRKGILEFSFIMNYNEDQCIYLMDINCVIDKSHEI